MNTLVSDLTAFQLMIIVVAGNVYFWGFVLLWKKLQADPSEQTPFRRLTTWAVMVVALGFPVALTFMSR